MRLREDSCHYAGWKRAILLEALVRDEPWSDDFRAFMETGEAAQPGDVWEIARYTLGPGAVGWTGYALTCPEERCPEGVHVWDHAWSCTDRSPAHPSCWVWTGSAEAGDLSAMPSLHVVAERGGCGWHGWLRNGEMVLA